MSSATSKKALLAVNHLLQIPKTSSPFLQGLKCSNCGYVATDIRVTCPACFERDSLSKLELTSQGEVIAFTVVRRSFPGLPVPFVSAVIALNGGGDIKVNIENIDVDSPALKVGLNVELIFKQAPWGDEHGNEYMIYAAQPIENSLHVNQKQGGTS
jgi:hypothetical protein